MMSILDISDIRMTDNKDFVRAIIIWDIFRVGSCNNSLSERLPLADYKETHSASGEVVMGISYMKC